MPNESYERAARALGAQESVIETAITEAQSTTSQNLPRNPVGGVDFGPLGPTIGGSSVTGDTTAQPTNTTNTTTPMPTTTTNTNTEDIQIPFLPTMPRRFGVELEAMGMDIPQATACLHAAGLAVRGEGHTHRASADLDIWRVVYDGSLGGGFEAVSPATYRTREIWAACRALRAQGGNVTQRCGTHVHVDAAGATLDVMRRVAKIWLRFEMVMNSLVSRSRRNNGYCVMNSAHMDSNGNRSMDQRFRVLDQCDSMQNIRRQMQSTRFAQLNLEAFWRHGTIEFRLHGGTLNGTKLSRWITVVVGMVQAAFDGVDVPAEHGTLEQLTELVRDALPQVFMEEVDVEEAEPREETYTETEEVVELTGWEPREGGNSANAVLAFDIVWHSHGCPNEISDEVREQMGLAARSMYNLSAGNVRVYYSRWRGARLGQVRTVTHTRTRTVTPTGGTTTNGERFQQWFATYLTNRVAVLA
jgi:hypothetical protein